MPEPPPAPMNLVVDGFARLLAADPSPVLPASRIRAQRPSLASDLPFVAIGLQLGAPSGRGLGRLIQGERRAPVPGDPPLSEQWALRFNGVATLELWHASKEGIVILALRADERLSERRSTCAHGFLQLEPAGLGPAEHTTRSASVGSAFSAWSQLLEYRFQFETWPDPEDGGGIIERIDVDLSHLPDPGPEERMAIPPQPSTEGG